MMDLIVHPSVVVAAIYSEQIDFTALGKPAILRASHVEPDGDGQWWADLGPTGGPKLGPFANRSNAIAAETTWLGERLADLTLD
jgi:hypothetical protein